MLLFLWRKEAASGSDTLCGSGDPGRKLGTEKERHSALSGGHPGYGGWLGRQIWWYGGILWSGVSEANAGNIYDEDQARSQDNSKNGEIIKYPLWVAEYGVSKPRDNGKWNSYVGWQYTNMGNIKGINGNVDRDKFTKDIFINGNTASGDVIPEIPEPESSYKTITILRGDTLSKIAKEYGTTVNELARINNIQNINLIYAGKTLRVPISNSQENNNLEEIVYIVKRGDTLSKIAMEYNVTTNEIARENQIKNVNLIYPGQRLIIKTKAIGTELGHLCYKVVRGDTLYSIARRYNTTISNIVMLNRIQNPNLIYPGQCLKINRW